jgi:hypothetical protein
MPNQLHVLKNLSLEFLLVIMVHYYFKLLVIF